jgi:hypothetical protein
MQINANMYFYTQMNVQMCRFIHTILYVCVCVCVCVCVRACVGVFLMHYVSRVCAGVGTAGAVVLREVRRRGVPIVIMIVIIIITHI